MLSGVFCVPSPETKWRRPGWSGGDGQAGARWPVWLQSGESGPGVSALVTSDNAETRGDQGGLSVVTQETGNIGQSLLVSAEGPQLYLTGSDDH